MSFGLDIISGPIFLSSFTSHYFPSKYAYIYPWTSECISDISLSDVLRHTPLLKLAPSSEQ